MLLEAVKVGAGDNKAAGRWRLNSGSEMVLTVGSLSKKPVRVVVDFATAKFKGDRVVALHDHADDSVIGFWDRPDISSKGIEADLHLMEAQNEMEANVLAKAIQVGAMARAGVPIQVSIGAHPGKGGQYEKIGDEETVECNGRKYSGSGDCPLYILRGALIEEGSIVTFGADSETGRIAATRHVTPVKKEHTMSDKLKAALSKYAEKYHGLVARCVADDLDDSATASKIHASELTEKDSEITALKASLTALEAKVTELSTSLAAKATSQETSDKVKAAAKSSDKAIEFTDKGEGDKFEPKTLTEAMNGMIKAGRKERGFALRAVAINEYPNVDRK
jgi:hypothetical protein